ncbi:MAG: hypothetical protein MPK03_00140, partial [Alphaproteobacteria bacterium]|nr:hypothetical protein [Alphaproteobacteria bacterium]
EGARLVRVPVDISYLPATPPAGVTFTATAAGTATVNTDYTFTTNTVTFTRDDSSKRQFLEVTITEDTILERDDTIILTILPQPPYSVVPHTSGEPATHTLTVEDNEPKPSLSVAAVTVAEGGRATLTATLSGPVSEAINGEFETADGTGDSGAVGGTDFTAVTNGTFTIPANQTTATFNVQTTQDQIHEGNETFNVTISTESPFAEVRGRGGTARVTITDDESVPSLSVQDINASESTGTATLTVTLSGVSSRDVRGTFRITPGTARLNTDYRRPSSTTFEIPAGSRTATIAIPLVVGTDNEDPETFTVTIASSNSRVATASGSTASATVTVRDSLVAVLTLKRGATVITELSEADAAGAVTAEVSLGANLLAGASVPVTVTVTVPSGVSAVASQTVNFAANEGAAVKTLTFTIPSNIANSVNDDDRTVSFSAAANPPPSRRDEVANAAAVRTITVKDDDPVVSMSVTPTTVVEGRVVTVTMTSAKPVSEDLVVPLVIAGAGADAAEPADLLGAFTGRMITIAAGRSSGTHTVGTVNDTALENSEGFSVNLGTLPRGTKPGVTAQTVTITDNDSATLSIERTKSVAEDVSAGNVELTITLSAAAEVAVAGTYSTADGTATAGDDYDTRTNQAFSIAPGSTTATATVGIIDDEIYEANENFRVTITPTSPSGVTARAATATVTITEDDAAPEATMDDATLNVAEADGTVTLGVSLDREASTAVAVGYTIAAGDTNPASAADLTRGFRSGTVNFPAGTTTAEITIAVRDDGAGDGGETFKVTLTPRTPVTVGTANETVVTINEAIVVSVAILKTSDSSALTTLNETAAAADRAVTLSVTLSEDIAAGGTALPVVLSVDGVTVTPSPATLTFNAGQGTTAQTATFTLPASINNRLVEPDRTVTVTANPTVAGGRTDVTDTDGTDSFTIESDDGAALAVVANPPSIQAGGAQTTTIEGQISTIGSGTGAHSIAVASGGGVTFRDGATGTNLVFTDSNNDSLISGSELTANVSFSARAARNYDIRYSVVGSSVPTGLTTSDFIDGTASLQVTALPALSIEAANQQVRVNEGDGTATVTVTITPALAVASTVNLFTGNDAVVRTADARNPGDYGNPTTPLTLPAGQTTVDFTVPITDDTAVEEEETFWVFLGAIASAPYSITANSAGPTGRAAAFITIIDDDATTLQIAADDVAFSVTEGDADQTPSVTVETSKAYGKAGNVNIAVSGTAETADATVPATSAVAATGTEHEISVTIVGDDIVEPDETVILTISRPPADDYTLGARTTSTITVGDDDTAALTVTAAANPLTNTPFAITGVLGAQVEVPANGSITFTDSGTTTSLAFADDGDGAATAGDGLLTDDELTASVMHTATTAATLSLDYNFTDAHGLVAADFTGGTASVTVAMPRTLSVADADATISVTETEATQTITVNLVSVGGDFGASQTATVAITGSPANTDVDPVAGSDYTAVTSVSLNATGTAHSFTIPILGDDIVEPTETFVVTISAAGGSNYVVDAAKNTSTVTITDNDTTGITFTTNPSAPVTGEAFTVSGVLEKMIQSAAAPATGGFIGVNFRRYEGGDYLLIEFRDDDSDGLIGNPASEATSQGINTGPGARRDPLTFTESSAGATTARAFAVIPSELPAGFRADQFTSSDFSVTVAAPTPPVIGFMETAVSVNEPNDGETDATVTLTIAPDKNLGAARTVNVAIEATASTSDVAAEGDASDIFTDYTPPATTVNLNAAGNTTITIPVKGDNMVEAEETFVVALTTTDATHYTVDSAKAKATVTITDNDMATVANYASVPDPLVPAGTFTVTGTLTNPVQYASSNVNDGIVFEGPGSEGFFFWDKNNDGYIAAANELTESLRDFSPSTRPAKTFTAPAAGQTFAFRGFFALDTSDGELAGLLGSHQGGDGFYTGVGNPFTKPGDVVFTVPTPATRPTVSFASATAAHTETDGDSNLTLTLNVADGPLSGTGTLEVTIGSDSDTSTKDATSSDYGTVSDVTISTSATTVTFDVPIKGDTIVEPDKVFVVTIVKPSGQTAYDLGTQTTSTVTLTDNDEVTMAFTTMPPNPTVGQTFRVRATIQQMIEDAFAPSEDLEYDDGGTGDAYLYFYDSNNDGVYAGSELVEDVTDGLSGRAEYTASSEGEFEADIYSLATDLTGSGFRAAQFPAQTVTVTIGAEPKPTLEFNAATYTHPEGDADANLTVTLTSSGNIKGGAGGTVTIGYGDTADTTDVGATGSGTDYTATTTATLQTTGTSHTFTIPVKGDQVIEADETIALTLTKVGDVYDLGTQTAATVTITDDDTGTLTVAGPASNPQPNANFDVTGTLNSAVQVPANGSITFTDTGATSAPNIVFTDSDSDGLIAANASATVSHSHNAAAPITLNYGLTAAHGLAANKITSAAVTVTVENIPSLSIADVSVAEDAGNAELTITLSEARGEAISGTWATAPGAGDTGAGAADYTVMTGVAFSVPANMTTVTVSVPITDDSAWEQDETFTVTITSGDTSKATVGTGTATVTITDNDTSALTAEFLSGGSPITEIAEASATGTATVRVNLSSAMPAGTSLTLTLTGSNGLTGTPSVTLNAGQTTVNGSLSYDSSLVNADNDDDRQATSVVAHSSGFNSRVTGLPFTARLTVKDDDPVVDGLSVTTATVAEGGTVQVTATTAKNVNSDLVIPLALAGSGTNAAAAADITGGFSGKTVTISSGTKTGTGTFTIVDDSANENAETFTVNVGTLPRGTTSGVSAVTVTIPASDAPVAAPVLQFASGDVTKTVNEGDSGDTAVSFSVTLDKAVASDTTVTIALSGTGSAAANSDDYTDLTSATVTAAGGLSQSFTVNVSGDTTVEPDETMQVVLSSVDSSIYTIGPAATSTVTLTNDDSADLTVSSVPAAPVAGDAFMIQGVLDSAVQVAADGSITFTDSNSVGGDLTFTDSDSDGLISSQTERTATVSYTHASVTADIGVDYDLTAAHSLDAADFTGGDDTIAVTAKPVFTLGPGGSGPEASGAIVLTPSADKAVVGALTVTFEVSGASSADYTTNGMAPVPDGSRDGRGEVTLVDDDIVEPDETLTFTLTATANSRYTVGTSSSNTFIVRDNDTANLAVSAVGSLTQGSQGQIQGVLDDSVQVPAGETLVFTGTGADLEFADDGAGGAGGAVTRDGLLSGGELTATANWTPTTSGATTVTYTAAAQHGLVTADFTGGTASINVGARTLAVADASATLAVTETEAAQTLTINLVSGGGDLGSGQTVNIAVTSPTGAAGADYTAITTANLAATGTAHSFDISILGDTVIEPTETFTVTLTAAGSGYVVDSAKNNSVITVTDNDIANVTFFSTPANPTVGQAFTITGTLDKMVQEVSQPVEYANATSTSYLYFLDSNNDGIIGSPATELVALVEDDNVKTRMFVINTAGDFTDTLIWADYTEGFRAAQFPNQTATITIAAANDVALSVDANSKNEGDTVTVTATADNNVAADTVIPLTLATGSGATADDISGAFTGRSITIASGASSATATISVTDDSLVEPSETFTIDIGTLPAGFARKSGDVAETITITDTDAASITLTAVGTLTQNSAGMIQGVLSNQVVVPSGETLTFTGSGGAASLLFADDGDGATANDGLISGGELTATAAWTPSSSGTVTLTYAAAAQHSLTTTNLPGGTADLTVAAAAPTTTLAFRDTVNEGGEAAGKITVTLTSSAAIPTAASANIAYAVTSDTTDFDASAGDYTENTSVTLQTSGTAHTFDITVADDDIVEPLEAVALTLSKGSGAYILGSRAVALARIADDDTAALTVTTSANPVAGTAFTITGTLDKQVAVPVGQSISFTDSTTSTTLTFTDSTGPSGSGASDGLLTDGELTATATYTQSGTAAATLSLDYNASGAQHGLSANKFTGGTATVNVASSVVTKPVVQFSSAATANSIEAITAPTIELSVDTAFTGAAVAIPYTLSSTTATAGRDYTVTSSVNFAAGTTTHNLTLAILNDNDVEPAETITVTLDTPGPGARYTLGSQTTHAFTITANDQATLTVTAVGTPGANTPFKIQGVLTNDVQVPAGGTLTFAEADGDTPDIVFTDSNNDGILGGTERTAQRTADPEPRATTRALAYTQKRPPQNGLAASQFAGGTASVTVGATGSSLPVVSFVTATASSTLTEGVGFIGASLAADRAVPSAADLTVNFDWSIVGGGNSKGDLPTVNGSITKGTNSGGFGTLPPSDAIVEPQEMLRATIVAGTGYTVDSAKNTYTTTINDNDTAALTIADPTSPTAGTAFTLSGTLGAETQVPANGTLTFADSGSDGGPDLVFADDGRGDGTAGDGILTGDELTTTASYTVSGTAAKTVSLAYRLKAATQHGLARAKFTGGAKSVAVAAGTGVPALPKVAFAAATYAATETDADSNLQVTLNITGGTLGGSGGTVNVTIGADSDSDTVNAGTSDYGTVSAVTIGAAATSVNFNVPIKGDTVIEPEETFVLTLGKVG